MCRDVPSPTTTTNDGPTLRQHSEANNRKPPKCQTAFPHKRQKLILGPSDKKTAVRTTGAWQTKEVMHNTAGSGKQSALKPFLPESCHRGAESKESEHVCSLPLPQRGTAPCCPRAQTPRCCAAPLRTSARWEEGTDSVRNSPEPKRSTTDDGMGPELKGRTGGPSVRTQRKWCHAPPPLASPGERSVCDCQVKSNFEGGFGSPGVCAIEHGGCPGAVLEPDTPKHFGPLKGGWVGGGGWAGTKNTNRYIVPGLSFEGGIFNVQQTTFVPICPHGEERSMGPQNQKWLHNSYPLWGPGKMPRKN